MPALLRACLLALCLAWPASAQSPVSPAESSGIRDVITRQLDAFRHDDAAAAFAFATPDLQARFGSAARFLDMVRQSYQPVYRARQAEFSELARRDGVLVQEVELVGPSGETALALYTMERDAAGGWRISACILIPSVRVGA